MQIEIINENQIQIFLFIDDLKQNNISIHSFMCNSSVSKNLFLNILTFANDKIGFTLKNHEIIIEAFSVPSKGTFILVITRIPKRNYLKLTKSNFGFLKSNKSLWLKFNHLEDFCLFCNSLQNISKIESSLYLLDNYYFLHIKLNKFKDYLMFSIIANEFSSKIYNNNFLLDEKAETIVKKSAIQICKKYFV